MAHPSVFYLPGERILDLDLRFKRILMELGKNPLIVLHMRNVIWSDTGWYLVKHVE